MFAVSLPSVGLAESNLVSIPGGIVTLGDPQGAADEVVREVEIAPFAIGRTEVTNAAFAAFVEATGYVTDAERRGGGFVWPGKWRFQEGADWRHPQGPDDSIEGRDRHPVVQVSQRDAFAYCAHLEFRLPSEAEWEYAARGREWRRYPWGDEPPMQAGERRANFGTVACCALDDSDGYRRTAPVGSFPAGRSPFGLDDMAGNVWEWTSTIEGGEALIKGGGFGNNPDALRIGIRHKNPPSTALDMVGFRCAGG
jgi:formylglycine-generating enzyme required for sulfatase activity